MWLNNVDLAKHRVKKRVEEGGHNIPNDIIERRYYRGLQNLFSIYLNIVDNLIVVDNSNVNFEIVYRKTITGTTEILNQSKFDLIKALANS